MNIFFSFSQNIHDEDFNNVHFTVLRERKGVECIKYVGNDFYWRYKFIKRHLMNRMICSLMGLKKPFMVLFLLSFVCCSEHTRKMEIANAVVDNSEIVLIFNNWTNDYSTYNNFSIHGDILSLIPFNGNLIPLNFSEKMRDTMIILPESEGLQVLYRYNIVNYINFLIHQGDTIVFTKEGNSPFVSIKNRVTKLYDINYDYYRNNRYGLIDGYAMPCYYDYEIFPIIFWMNGKPYDRDSIEQIIKFQLEDEWKWLDSLKNENLISEREYIFYQERNKFMAILMNQSHDRNKTKEEYRELLLGYNDSVYYNDRFRFYRTHYQKLANKYYLDKIILLSNSRIEDCKYAFDKMEEEDLIFGDLRQSMMLKWLPDIIKYNSVSTGKEYYEKVLAALSDTVLRERVRSEFAMVFDEALLNSKELELLDKYGEKISFETLLKKNVGKVIYVDFWASWCMPCMREMIPAADLRKKYVGKDVVFFYLTLDDKKEAWTKGVENAQLGEVMDNYFILNMKTAPLIRDLKINEIPRYLIYNKTGSLVYTQAPSPGSKVIVEILDKFLKE